MAAGVPMYYLTARSRAMTARKEAVNEEGGFKGVLTGRKAFTDCSTR